MSDEDMQDQDKVVPIRQGVAMKGQGKNEHGLTARQEAFAHLVAEGHTLSEAYRRAYRPPASAAATIQNKASATMRLDHVKARVDAIVAQNRVERSLDSAQMLEFVRNRLLLEAQNSASKPADRLKALELIGKLSDVAAFRERIVEEQADTKSAVEMEREIKRKLEKILAA